MPIIGQTVQGAQPIIYALGPCSRLAASGFEVSGPMALGTAVDAPLTKQRLIPRLPIRSKRVLARFRLRVLPKCSRPKLLGNSVGAPVAKQRLAPITQRVQASTCWPSAARSVEVPEAQAG